MPDNLTIFGLNYNDIVGFKAVDQLGNEITYTRYPVEVPDLSDPSPVCFYDYDGTLLYSYSVSDFLALDAMPANPSHTGLTAAGWNWTLANAKAYVNAYGAIDIGQEYNETVLFLSIPRDPTGGLTAPYLGLAISGTVTVDWGDGNTQNITGTSLTTQKRTQHTYATAGDYAIKISVVSGSFTFCGSSSSALLGASNGSTASTNKAHMAALKAISLGRNMTTLGQYGLQFAAQLRGVVIPKTMLSIGQYAFQLCSAMQYICYPETITSLGVSSHEHCDSLKRITCPPLATTLPNYIFRYCGALRSVVVPNGVTAIGSSAFQYCYALPDIVLPSTVTSIGSYAFGDCASLADITLPSGLETISNYAFYNVNRLRKLDIPSMVTQLNTFITNSHGLCELVMRPTAPPTLASGGLNSMVGGVIRVPSASLSAYQGATNWSAYASRMVAM